MQGYDLIVSSDGQATIPAEYIKDLGLEPYSKIRVKILPVKKSQTKIISSNSLINSIKNQEYSLDDLPKIVGKVRKISDKEIEESLKYAFAENNLNL
jgi:bifunctional DNA-binding transcriptional regulator/antitoxin component of YhaV-PrlF toxin-antitoxin module